MKKKKLSKSQEQQEKFEQFIFEMSDSLEAFLNDATKSGFRLDYSIESLASLEEYVLIHCTSMEDRCSINRAARYLGEVFRKNMGGKWELCLKSPRYLYHELPVIAGYSNLPIEFCPLVVINNLVLSRKIGLLSGAVEANRQYATKSTS